jgi:hypothetical protein
MMSTFGELPITEAEQQSNIDDRALRDKLNECQRVNLGEATINGNRGLNIDQVKCTYFGRDSKNLQMNYKLQSSQIKAIIAYRPFSFRVRGSGLTTDTRYPLRLVDGDFGFTHLPYCDIEVVYW